MDALGVLQRLGSGKLLDELHEALVTTAQEVVETGNPGAVTLKLRISTRGQGNALITVEESVGRTPPVRAPKGAILWALDGDLYGQDPRQMKMELRAVDMETGEIREPVAERAERSL